MIKISKIKFSLLQSFSSSDNRFHKKVRIRTSVSGSLIKGKTLLTCVSSVRKTSLRLDGFFPLVKPIIAAVTSRLLTGPRLPSWPVNVSVLYVGMAKRDGQDKPQFSYLMWWCYYGRHILIKHYLNTLYPSSGSVSYSSEM